MAPQAGIDMSDESLMALIKKGDHQAFAHLVRRHTDKFYALAWRMTGSDQEAEDVVQEAFLKLWDKPEAFNPKKGARFTTWFYRVVNNLAVDRLRGRRKMQPVDFLENVTDERASQHDDMEETRRQADMEAAIQNLPDKQKTALNLCFYEGLSNKEAAEIMGVKLKALESLLMRAKSGIKDQLLRAGVLEV